jgi:ribosomal protein S18 acetylase RimI-like enzyme
VSNHMSDVKIQYASESLLPSFREALDQVARERIYIEMVEAPPLEKVLAFHGEVIQKNQPVYFAVHGEKVVGWCDILPERNPRRSHRGGLGMGLLPGYRRQGLGSQLLVRTLSHAQEIGLEKVELEVFTENLGAVALYKKFGFEIEGTLKHYRKLDGKYFDCLVMAKFL